MAPTFQNRGRARGFTLIELLTAMTVLLIMLALLTEMLDLAAKAWKTGVARADHFTQTRVVLGLIQRDIQAMILRPDVAAFSDAKGNPALAFYTRFAGGGNTNRKVSLVQYVVTTGTTPQLLRYDNGGFDYTITSSPEMQLVSSTTASLTDLPTSPLTTSSQNATAVPSGLDEAQILVKGVVALQMQFLRRDGTFQSSFQFDYNNASAAANTPTVIISIAVLDGAAYQMATSASVFGKISADLGTSPAVTQTYAQYWNTRIDSPSFGSDLPQPIRAGLRVFERRISIPLPLTIIH